MSCDEEKENTHKNHRSEREDQQQEKNKIIFPRRKPLVKLFLGCCLSFSIQFDLEELKEFLH